MPAVDTNHSTGTFAASAAEKAIHALDLAPLKRKLQDRKEGEGWTSIQVDLVERWYKRLPERTRKIAASSSGGFFTTFPTSACAVTTMLETCSAHLLLHQGSSFAILENRSTS